MSYQARAYHELPPTLQQLYDYLVRYHHQHGGRRASRAEMRLALNLSRDPLNNMLFELESAGLFITELNARGKARSYTLPGERWSHPHLSTLELSKTFYTGTLFDQA